MTNVRKFKTYLKLCRRCNNLFIGDFRYSRVCQSCMKPRGAKILKAILVNPKIKRERKLYDML
jgi:hypothetical protein